MTKEMAEQIVFDIMNDIKGRSGIGNEFEMIDPDIREELFNEWTEIVLSGSEI